MKFPANAKIEAAVSTDKHRGPLTEAYLDTTGQNPVLVATDGHIMACVPVEADTTEQGFVSPVALKAARKLARKSKTADLSCNGSLATVDGTQYPRSTEQSTGFYTYPRWREVVRVQADTTGEPVRIGLDASLLMKLAEALGSDTVILEIRNPLSCVKVTPSKATDERFGLIMPVKI